MKLTKEFALHLLEKMLEIRFFEEKIVDQYARGNVPSLAHLYIGEEAVAVGACASSFYGKLCLVLSKTVLKFRKKLEGWLLSSSFFAQYPDRIATYRWSRETGVLLNIIQRKDKLQELVERESRRRLLPGPVGCTASE